MKARRGRAGCSHYRAQPSPTALAHTGCLLEIEGFAPNYHSAQPESVRLPSLRSVAKRCWHRRARGKGLLEVSEKHLYCKRHPSSVCSKCKRTF
jgi:hypothetical protein